MAESEQEVETKFTGDDRPLQSVINRMVGGAARVNSAFNKASEMLGGFASISAVVGGAFSLEKAVESTTEYMRSIDRVSMLTGLSVNHTDALLESMEKVGIEGETAERIMLGMSRRTATAEQHMNALGQATGSTAGMLRGLGINMKKDTVDVLEQMAEKVQQNKIGVAQLGTAFGVPRTQTLALYEMLKKGPGYIRENIEEVGRLGVVAEDVANFKRMQNAQRDIKASWNRISVIVGTQLLPLFSDLLESGAKKLKGWVESAKEFGRTMSSFLREHYAAVLRIGKVMLANAALQRMTGRGIGGLVFGGKNEEGEYKKGAWQMASGAFGKAKAWSFRDQGAGAQGPARAGISGVLDKIRLTFGSFGSFFAGAARFALVGAAVAGVALVIYGAFSAIKNNVLGIRQYLMDLWERIALRFRGIGIALQPLFNLFGSNGVVGNFFAKVMVSVIHGLGFVVEGILSTMHTLIHVFAIIKEDGLGAMSKPKLLWQTASNAAAADMAIAARMERDRRARDAAAETAKRDVPKDRDRQPVFDFRGSRFDIKQAFSDVDPDRIAVAFANDLAGMGERRVQSSLAPLFAV